MHFGDRILLKSNCNNQLYPRIYSSSYINLEIRPVQVIFSFINLHILMKELLHQDLNYNNMNTYNYFLMFFFLMFISCNNDDLNQELIIIRSMGVSIDGVGYTIAVDNVGVVKVMKDYI